ncbi:MAG: PadR family transcriptional regulator [Variovorax paradoxus]|nr:MAG: PadR family transcriptional regulator [Variovorax paradoxus]PZQ01077.1 MAG: PadR family transcriptional regulator [Variovorax paradoxus]
MTDTVRDILLAFVRVHVLHHAVAERIFGAGMAQELARHGYRLSPGTLYPLLHRLEADGLLKCSAEVVGGKTRKYYVATAKGHEALETLRPKLAELSGETIAKTLHDDIRPSRPRRTRQP